MNEIKLNVDGKIYRLTNINNNTKYERAVKDAGEKASPKQILAYYDKYNGYIQNEQGQIKNGLFWIQEKENVSAREKRMKKIKTVLKITEHPVVATILVIMILAILLYKFGIDLRGF